MDKDIKAIAALAKKYFDALYGGDVELLAGIFHRRARLYCNNSESFVTMGVTDYLELVCNRTNPIDRGDARLDEVLQIIISTPTTAVLRTREVFLSKRFTDDLSLMKLNGEWKIVAKAWDFEVVE